MNIIVALLTLLIAAVNAQTVKDTEPLQQQRSLLSTFEVVDLELWEGYHLSLTNYQPSLLWAASFVLYSIFVFYVWPATRPSEADRPLWKARWSTHNFIMFSYSGITFVWVSIYLYLDGQLFPGNWRVFDFDSFYCRPVEGTILRPISTVFTLSKIYEWVDTMFQIYVAGKAMTLDKVVTRGSQKTESRRLLFLHFYHHATTFWLFMIMMAIPAPEKLGVLLNSGVHTLMYAHYWWKWPAAWSKVITIAQIVQLAYGTYAWNLSGTTAVCPDAQFTTAFEDYPFSFMTPNMFVPVYLLLFMKFYVQRNCTRSTTSPAKKRA